MGEDLVSFYPMLSDGRKNQQKVITITTNDTNGDTNLYSKLILDSIDDVSEQIKDIVYIVIHKATTQLQEYVDPGGNIIGCFEGLVDAGAINISFIEFEEGSQLESIFQRAFYGCDSRNITIPDSVVEIYEEAFFGTKNLKTFTISVNSKLAIFPKYKKIDSYNGNLNSIMPKIFDQQANSGKPPEVYIPIND